MSRLLTIATILLLLVIFASCDTVAPPTVIDTASLAPARPDQNVYAIPETKEYHLSRPSCLTDSKVVMLASDAEAEGYTACEICFPPPEEPREPHVYVVEGDPYYHYALCSNTFGKEKTAIPKTQAVEEGYLPDPDCTTVIRLRGDGNRIVFITENGREVSGVYHTSGQCHYLDDGWGNDTLLITTKWEAENAGYRPSEGTCPDTDNDG